MTRPTELRVLSLNVRCDLGWDGPNNWEFRHELVAERVQGYHLLGFQEVLPSQRSDLERALPEFQWFGRGRQPGGEGEQCAIAIHPSLPVIEHGTFWLSEEPEQEASLSWDSCLTRICSWARTPHFTFANTHFDHQGYRAREQSARLLCERIAQPAILVGDLNCEPNSRPLEVLKARWNDTYGTLYPDDLRGTFQGFGEFEEELRIDYVLCESNFAVRRASILTASPPYYSDHYAVTATVVLEAT